MCSSIEVSCKNRRYEESGITVISQRNLGISFEVGDHSYCRSSPRISQCRGGHRILQCQGLQRVEAQTEHISTIESKEGYPRNIFVCISNIPSTANLCSMETRSIQKSSGCISDKLEEQICLCVSTLLTDRENIKEGPNRSCIDASDYTPLAVSNLVLSIIETECEEPNSYSYVKRTYCSIQKGKPIP